ncbi:uncharacterized protein LOC123797974 [Ursus americanus]|uniref:uncharacterized protein LOC123797974 n=1 Tax=Ursus americanus TaxID=9643 RepID=UPI001E67B59B|nr:uncharacterized protein LOC123797974 [Ursus americanus]
MRVSSRTYKAPPARRQISPKWVFSAPSILSRNPEGGLGQRPHVPPSTLDEPRRQRGLWRRNAVEKPVPRQFGERRAVLHRRRFPGPLPKILTGRNAGSHPPKPPNSQPSQFSSPRLPPAGRIGPGGFLSSRTPPYAQHLLTARAPRPALSPRPPTRRGRGPLVLALSPRSPALHFTCLRGPEAGGSLSEAPPPRSSSPPLCFRISRQYFPVPSRPQLPDPGRVRPRLSPGLRPGGGCTGEHSQEVAILRRTMAVPLRPQGTGFFRKRRRDQESPPLREERRFGWRAGQWEARTAAQRGAAAECKHSRARGGPRVSPRATRRVWDHRGRPWHPRAAILRDACFAFCSSPAMEELDFSKPAVCKRILTGLGKLGSFLGSRAPSSVTTGMYAFFTIRLLA